MNSRHGGSQLNMDQSVSQAYFDLLYCDLDDNKIKAMQLFFDSLQDQGILNERPEIQFF